MWVIDEKFIIYYYQENSWFKELKRNLSKILFDRLSQRNSLYLEIYENNHNESYITIFINNWIFIIRQIIIQNQLISSDL